MEKKSLLEIAARFCDRCGSRYNTSDVEIVREMGGSILLMLNCHNCGSSHLVNFVISKGVGTRLAIHTDLYPDEIKDIPIGSGVETNELLDLHIKIKDEEEVSLAFWGSLFFADQKLAELPKRKPIKQDKKDKKIKDDSKVEKVS